MLREEVSEMRRKCLEDKLGNAVNTDGPCDNTATRSFREGTLREMRELDGS